MDWSIKVTDLAIIVATFVSPILAVWAAEIRQNRKQARDRKEWVFRTLMTSRGARLTPDHVAAINMIEFAFPREDAPKVETARKLYRMHLKQPDSYSLDPGVQKGWTNKANDLFADLLCEMAVELKVPFTRADITEESYHPDAYLFNQVELTEIRRLVLEVLKHGRPINVRPIVDHIGVSKPAQPAQPAQPPA